MDTPAEASKKTSMVRRRFQGRPLISRDHQTPKHLMLQNVGLKITKSEDGDIKISNPTIIHRLFLAHGLENCNTTQVHHQISADLKGHEAEKHSPTGAHTRATSASSVSWRTPLSL